MPFSDSGKFRADVFVSEVTSETFHSLQGIISFFFFLVSFSPFRYLTERELSFWIYTSGSSQFPALNCAFI